MFGSRAFLYVWHRCRSSSLFMKISFILCPECGVLSVNNVSEKKGFGKYYCISVVGFYVSFLIGNCHTHKYIKYYIYMPYTIYLNWIESYFVLILFFFIRSKHTLTNAMTRVCITYTRFMTQLLRIKR